MACINGGAENMHKWSTEISEFKFGDESVLKEICRFILAQELSYKKTTEIASLKGPSGFHSSDDILAGNIDWQIELSKKIKKECYEYLRRETESTPDIKHEKLSCWAMIMREGDYSTVHCHPGADVSGVFYLKVPELSSYQGCISFIDPRPGAKTHRYYCGRNTSSIIPQQGQGFVFPPWLDHYVHPHRTKDTRISLAFNYSLN